MKPLGLLLLLGFSFGWLCSGAEFRNLGFDEADTTDLASPSTPRPEGPGSTAKLLPGWKLSLGSTVQGQIYVNQTLLPPQIDHAELGDTQKYGDVTEERFALRLERANRESAVWHLEQTGTIPADAQFLTYRTWFFEMQVWINGQIVPPLNAQSSGSVGEITNLAYDISQFAGQEVKLEFVGPLGPPTWPDSGGIAYIDSVAFVVLEPRIAAITQSAQADGSMQTVISFSPSPGKNNVVEFRQDLGSNANWQPLPGAPHNSGSVTDVSAGPQRFYRLRILDR